MALFISYGGWGCIGWFRVTGSSDAFSNVRLRITIEFKDYLKKLDGK